MSPVDSANRAASHGGTPSPVTGSPTQEVFEEVQAVLLNSACPAGAAVVKAMEAVVLFAASECEATEEQMAALLRHVFKSLPDAFP